MAFEPEVIRAASAELARRRAARQRQQEKRRQEIYTALPEVQQIDRRLRATMTELAAAALRAGADPQASVAAVREKNLSLQQRRTELLQAAGYSDDELDGAPACARCGDTGWVGREMCSCLRELCRDEQVKCLSSMLNLGEQSFDTFRLDYYSQRTNPVTGFSPRQNMELIYEFCVGYARRFPRFFHDNLLFTGGTGLGKTFLSACIAREVSQAGYSVVYDTASSVFDTFDRERFARGGEEGRQARDGTKRYLNCDLFILDDLGSELTSPLAQASLYTLVNTRIQAGRHTIISTNLALSDLRSRYSPQVCSRLEGEYHVLRFYGDDIRIRKKEQM